MKKRFPLLLEVLLSHVKTKRRYVVETLVVEIIAFHFLST